jgi:hypothetical protein
VRGRRPGDDADSLVLCRAFIEDGITAALATPRQFGAQFRAQRCCRAVREAIAARNRSLMVEGVPLRVFAGLKSRIVCKRGGPA